MPARAATILYFIADNAPTKEEAAAAAQLGTRRFRCVRFIGPDHTVEPCDAVAGAVPPQYAHLPRADASQGSGEGTAENSGGAPVASGSEDRTGDDAETAQEQLFQEPEAEPKVPRGRRQR